MRSAEQRLSIGHLPRHRHTFAYAAIVLQGGYVERGNAGRWTAGAGDIVAHGMLDSHDNQVMRPDTVVLNVDLPNGVSLPPLFRVSDPDALVRAVRAGDPDVLALLVPAEIGLPAIADWPDLLSRALRRGPVRIGAWARHNALAPATVSRGFRAAYSVTPARREAAATKARG
jgi:hypothetical protein